MLPMQFSVLESLKLEEMPNSGKASVFLVKDTTESDVEMI